MRTAVLRALFRLVNFVYSASKITSIEEAQRRLAFDDSQHFIYHNSSISTLTYNGSDAVERLRKACIASAPRSGLMMEFGVFRGKSISKFSKWMTELGDDRNIYGFDSFEGFSEEWSGLNEQYKVKTFDLQRELPDVPVNVKLVAGFVEDTLPKFIAQNLIESVAFVHIDTDTYTPARVVLTELKPYFKPGTIILFDELCGYPNWRNHEYKALSEVLSDEEYEFLGFAHNGKQARLIKAAIRIS